MFGTIEHESNRLKVCGCCGIKIVFAQKKKSDFIITSNLETLIKEHINTNFQTSDSRFPLGICGTCRITLNEYKRKINTRDLPKMPHYEEIQLSKYTRANGTSCDCYICITAKLKGHSKVQIGRGHKRNAVNIDVRRNTASTSSQASGTSGINNVADKQTLSIKICNVCFQEIGRGKQHTCNVATVARDNVLKLVEKLPDKQQEQLVTTILKRKFDSTDVGTTNSTTIKLSTLGSQMNVELNPKKTTSVAFSTENLDNFKNNTGASSNEMKKLTNFLRSNAGRKSVPVDYQKHVSEKSNILEIFYKDAIYEFDVTGSEKRQKRPVVWADAEELLQFIVEERRIQNNFVVKAMIDGGQNFFKISLSIMTKNDLPQEEEEVKRSLYSEGGSTAKKAKLTSVQRLILLCIVPDVKETYTNIQLLFNLTNINKIPFKLVCDFKVLLIINGQQTASSMYPCPYCFVTLHDLKVTQENKNSNVMNETDSEMTDPVMQDDDNSNFMDETDAEVSNYLKVSNKCLRLKTFGDLKNDFNEFNILSKKKTCYV